MAKVAVVTPGIGLEPIDRLEEKVKSLVNVIERLRAENAKAAEDNARLVNELSTVRARLAEAESAGSELAALRDERELIRTRVTDMIQQIDGLNL